MKKKKPAKTTAPRKASKPKAGRECYHCRSWIAQKDLKTHDCWTTTEEKLTESLPEELREAWVRLRETATDFGEQRIYASHKSIMFSRRNCYFFVRPQKNRLEVCFFVGRKIQSPMVRKAVASSKLKVAHLVHVVHRDEVEAPLVDWLREAYEVSETLRAKKGQSRSKSAPSR